MKIFSVEKKSQGRKVNDNRNKQQIQNKRNYFFNLQKTHINQVSAEQWAKDKVQFLIEKEI